MTMSILSFSTLSAGQLTSVWDSKFAPGSKTDEGELENEFTSQSSRMAMDDGTLPASVTGKSGKTERKRVVYAALCSNTPWCVEDQQSQLVGSEDDVHNKGQTDRQTDRVKTV